MENLLNKKVVVRCYYAGNWSGIVTAMDGNRLYLSTAFRLWSWTAKKGISLSDVANFGVSNGKICSPVNVILNMNDVYEIIESNDEAFSTIRETSIK